MLPIRKVVYTLGDQVFVFTLGQSIEGGKKQVHEIVVDDDGDFKHCLIKIIDKNGSIITWDESWVRGGNIKVQYDYNLIIDPE